MSHKRVTHYPAFVGTLCNRTLREARTDVDPTKVTCRRCLAERGGILARHAEEQRKREAAERAEHP